MQSPINPHFWSSKRRDATIVTFGSPKMNFSNFNNSLQNPPGPFSFPSPIQSHNQSLFLNQNFNPLSNNLSPPSMTTINLDMKGKKKAFSTPHGYLPKKSFDDLTK